MRWFVILLVVWLGCDRGLQREHRIHYEIGGLAQRVAPDPRVSDLYVKVVLDGDTRREIAQNGPMTAPCAKRLQQRIEALAPWPQ